MGFWEKNVPGRGKSKSSGEERGELSQGRSGNEGGRRGGNLTEISATRLCGQSWTKLRTFFFFPQSDHRSHWAIFLARESRGLTFVVYESLKSVFSL